MSPGPPAAPPPVCASAPSAAGAATAAAGPASSGASACAAAAPAVHPGGGGEAGALDASAEARRREAHAVYGERWAHKVWKGCGCGAGAFVGVGGGVHGTHGVVCLPTARAERACGMRHRRVVGTQKHSMLRVRCLDARPHTFAVLQGEAHPAREPARQPAGLGAALRHRKKRRRLPSGAPRAAARACVQGVDSVWAHTACAPIHTNSLPPTHAPASNARRLSHDTHHAHHLIPNSTVLTLACEPPLPLPTAAVPAFVRECPAFASTMLTLAHESTAEHLFVNVPPSPLPCLRLLMKALPSICS
eukprot:365835-Chlamydomonas_euryale.AAC.4